MNSSLDLELWNSRWVYVENGFTAPQPQLRSYVGLFAAKQGHKFMYIGAARNRKKSGLTVGLARAYTTNASGDGGWGMRMLRQQISNVDAYVIKLPANAENVELITSLKKAMLKEHDPQWNRRPETILAAIQASYQKHDDV